MPDEKTEKAQKQVDSQAEKSREELEQQAIEIDVHDESRKKGKE